MVEELWNREVARIPIKRPRKVDPGLRGDSKLRNKFDYRGYLERQNIFALINTKEDSITVLYHDYKSNPLMKYTYLLRGKLKNLIIEKMPLESGAFMRAILLGDRSELPRRIQKITETLSSGWPVTAPSGLSWIVSFRMRL